MTRNILFAMLLLGAALGANADDAPPAASTGGVADNMKPSARGAAMLDAEIAHRQQMVGELNELELLRVRSAKSEEELKIHENSDKIAGKSTAGAFPGAIPVVPPPPVVSGNDIPVAPLSLPKGAPREAPAAAPSLTGIVGDSAVFSVNGSTRVARAGEMVDGYHVDRVAASGVTVSQGSRTMNMPAPVR